MSQRLAAATILACAGYGLQTSVRTSLLLRRLTPRAAAGDAEAAASVTQTPFARALFGIPNSDLATAYYAMLLAMAGSGTLRRHLVLTATRLAAWGTTGFSAYLIHALFFRLHMRCPVCMRAHAVNLILTLTLQCALDTSAPDSAWQRCVRPQRLTGRFKA
jgi:uncharacterized membrane protein